VLSIQYRRLVAWPVPRLNNYVIKKINIGNSVGENDAPLCFYPSQDVFVDHLGVGVVSSGFSRSEGRLVIRHSNNM
jgi:hypothetical protein